MDRLALNNILRLNALSGEVEYERASSLFLKLRKLEKEESSYKDIRKHLKSLITRYEDENWSDEEKISDDQIRESDLAEKLIQAENEFYQKRKELIRDRLKATGLNQSDLAKILGHGKGYMSELINGLRPFSKEDIVVINRLFKIRLKNLIPTFIKQDRALHIRKTLNTLSNNKIQLTKKDLDLKLASDLL